jgi:phytoene dehydrogenase-like protein
VTYDAVVIGSGPNGLAAAVELAKGGASVLVLEAAEEIGGGTRTSELTSPGFLHDVCSAAHPMGGLSPFFRSLPLESHGLRWIRSPSSVAHPLDAGPAVILSRSIEETARSLGEDEAPYRKLFEPFLRDPHALLSDALAPLKMPRHPFLMARFGLRGLRSATALAKRTFRGAAAKALFAGCAAHAIQPLEHLLTGAIGIMFLFTAHVETWPIAEGGSRAITGALASYLASLGGEIRTHARVGSLSDLPEAKVFLFDTSPRLLARVAASILPAGYVRRLDRFRYGPGVFKMDWALDGPVPWSDPRCLEASTVHVGGTIEEIAASEAAMWRGEHPERPFVLFCQQSLFDPSRAPAGKHTGWGYCHVPNGSTKDMTEAMERQIERFAPGFKDRVLARKVFSTTDLERYNESYIGGAITGGVADLAQLFFRPVARFDPYSTPNPRLFLCSSSTPPGGGVHGMCGFFAARSAQRRLTRLAPVRLAG